MADDNQALAVKVGKWLYQHRDQQGTPEYQTAVSTYKKLTAGGSPAVATQDTPDTLQGPTPSWSELPGAALEAAPASAGNLAKNIVEGVGHAIVHPLDTLKGVVDTGTGLALNIPGVQAIQDFGDRTSLHPRSPQDIANDQVLKDQGAKSIANKENQYFTSEGFRNRMGNDPFGYVGDAATVLSPEMAAKGVGLAIDTGKVAKKAASALNKMKVEYPDAATSVAQDLRNSGFDMSKPEEANKAVAVAHNNIKTEIKSQRSLFADQLDPNALKISPEEAAKRMEANKALDSAYNKSSTQATPSQIAALDSLVGDTQQGAQLVHNLKKHIEVQALNNHPIGGVSQYLDALAPTVHGRLGIKSALATALAGANVLHAAASPATGIPLLSAQFGAPVVGHMIDRVTGRRIRAQKLMNDYGNTAPPDVGAGLTDVIAERKAAKDALAAQAAQAQAQREAAQATKEADAQATKDARQERRQADLENRQYDAEKRFALQQAKVRAAVEKAKQEAEAKANAPKPLDLGVSQMALKMAHQKARATTAALKRAAEAQTKAEAKTAAEAAKPVETPAPKKAAKGTTDNPDGYSNTAPRSADLYEAGKARVQAYEAKLEQTASGIKDPKLKKALLKAKEDLFNTRGLHIVSKHHARMEIYHNLLHKHHGKHARAVINKVVKPLAEAFKPAFDAYASRKKK